MQWHDLHAADATTTSRWLRSRLERKAAAAVPQDGTRLRRDQRNARRNGGMAGRTPAAALKLLHSFQRKRQQAGIAKRLRISTVATTGCGYFRSQRARCAGMPQGFLRGISPAPT